jgi:hypothetical protein
MPSIVLPGGGGLHTVVTKMTVLDIIRRAMEKVNIWAAGETPDTAEANTALQELNFLLDQWAARKLYVYANQFLNFTLIPGKLPMTIGTVENSPDFVVTTQRPIEVLSAQIVLQGGDPQVQMPPLNRRDDAWWANQNIKNLNSTLPTDLYYSADWPNGSLYFWPVPTVANQVQLQLFTAIPQFASLTDSFSFPPGYADALSLSLAEYVGTRWPGSLLTPDLKVQAQQARKTIQMLNNISPRLVTDAPSSPSVNSVRPDFNFLSGMSQ